MRREIAKLKKGSWTAAFVVAVVCSISFNVRAQNADDFVQKIEAAHRALDAWDLTQAQRLAGELAQALPDVPAVQGLLGRVKFHEGDFEGAVRFLERASEAGQVHPLLSLAKSTRDETQGSVSRESEHFVMRVPAGKDEALLDLGLETLEQAFAEVTKAFDFVPTHKIPVDVLHDTSGLANVSTLTRKEIETSGTIALCKYNRLMITSPKALARGYGWVDTLAHELIHMIISEKSANTVPIWLHEGLAKYSESLWRGTPGLALEPYSENLLAEAVTENKLITFEQMHPSMAKLPSQEDTALAFAEVFTVIEYLHQKHGGYASTNRLLEGLRESDDMNRALKKAVGQNLNAMQKTWKRYLKGRKFRRAPGVEPKKLRFVRNVRANDTTNDDEDAAIEAAVTKKGKRFVRLGNLLRTAGRLRAATVEYQKAFNTMSGRSTSLSNRLAGLYIELGEWERAEPIIQTQLKVSPDDPRTNILMGRLKLRAKKFDEAKKFYRASMFENPFNPEGWMALYKIAEEKKDEGERKRIGQMLELLSGSHASKSKENEDEDSKDFGTLSISSAPWGTLSLDGESTQRTTPVLDMRVPIGEYFIRVYNRATQKWAKAIVSVKAGESARVALDLENASSLEALLREEEAFVLAKKKRLSAKENVDAGPNP